MSPGSNWIIVSSVIVLGSSVFLSCNLQVMASTLSALLSKSTPTCVDGDNGSKHMRLGQACLNVENKASDILEFWAQALECYKCPPWPYLSLDPGKSSSLIVNTTYPTNIYIRNASHTDLYHMQYHFGEYGSYDLGLGSTNASSIHITRHPNNEYLAILLAALFYIMIAFMWQCTKFIRYRMDGTQSDHSNSPSLDTQPSRLTRDPSIQRDTVTPNPSPSLEPQPSNQTTDPSVKPYTGASSLAQPSESSSFDPQPSTSTVGPTQSTSSLEPGPETSTASLKPGPETSAASLAQPSESPGFEPQPSTSTVGPTQSSSTHTPLLSFPQPSYSSTSLHTPLLPAARLLSATQCPVPDTRREGGRLRSLDAFRGLAIVLMIFVNYGGGKYMFFTHARWNGLTVADLVFPFFIWIMGTSLVFSVRSQLRRATRRYVIVIRIIKRCLILFALGIVINSTNGNNDLRTLRILGVLQRFAICYFITAVIEVYCMNPQQSPEYVRYWAVRDIVRSLPQWIYTMVLVAVHTSLTFALRIPNCPTGYLGPGGLHDGARYPNCTGGAAGYIDRLILGEAHTYSHPSSAIIYNSNTPYDPEGLLGALTSALMVQLGAACGRIIMTFASHQGRVARWLIWATVTGIIAGCLCYGRKEGGLIPVNKNLWSLSYVLCTASFAFILFTIFYIVIDVKKWWTGNPLRYTGMNSILLYVGHEICEDLLPFSWKPVGQHHANFLIMNLWGMSLWVFVAYLLHKRKIYLSV